jgi:hypothetical protein
MNTEKSRNHDHDRFPWILFILGTILAVALPLSVASISNISMIVRASLFSLSAFIVAFIVVVIGLRKR